MENFKIKIKEVYIPFLLVSIGTILFYNLFRWTFDIKLGVLPLKEDLLNFWIPFALPWIPILVWIRRRIRILNVRGKRDNGYFGYQFVMAAAIAVPIIVSQNYIEKASFSLIELKKIDEVKEFKNEKYFTTNSFKVNKNSSLPYITARTSGRHNEDLEFYLYLSCPSEGASDVWYGVEYNKRISNRLDDSQKDLEYRNFIRESKQEFETYDFKKVRYFEKLGHSDDRDGFLEAIKEAKLQTTVKEQLILIPHNDNFENRLGSTFSWIFGSYGIGALILLVMVLIPKIDQKELKDFRNDRPLKEDDLKKVLKFLDPRGAKGATAILIVLNIIVFLLMIFSGLNVISPTAKELFEIGGNRRFEVLNGEYWRLLTSVFIHGGLAHLMMNLVGLGLGGSFLEGILGRTRLITSFLVCGIFASIASIFWHENTVSVGASGAIFGLYGIILTFTVLKIYPIPMRKLTWLLLGLYGGVSLLFGIFGGIDNAAHIGGLISGFLLGLILIIIEKQKLIKNASGMR